MLKNQRERMRAFYCKLMEKENDDEKSGTQTSSSDGTNKNR